MSSMTEELERLPARIKQRLPDVPIVLGSYHVTLARHAENMKSWADVRKYVEASSLFSFLFFNQENPSFVMLREMFGSGRMDAPVAK